MRTELKTWNETMPVEFKNKFIVGDYVAHADAHGIEGLVVDVALVPAQGIGEPEKYRYRIARYGGVQPMFHEDWDEDELEYVGRAFKYVGNITDTPKQPEFAEILGHGFDMFRLANLGKLSLSPRTRRHRLMIRDSECDEGVHPMYARDVMFVINPKSEVNELLRGRRKLYKFVCIELTDFDQPSMSRSLIYDSMFGDEAPANSDNYLLMLLSRDRAVRLLADPPSNAGDKPWPVFKDTTPMHVPEPEAVPEKEEEDNGPWPAYQVEPWPCAVTSAFYNKGRCVIPYKPEGVNVVASMFVSDWLSTGGRAFGKNFEILGSWPEPIDWPEIDKWVSQRKRCMVIVDTDNWKNVEQAVYELFCLPDMGYAQFSVEHWDFPELSYPTARINYRSGSCLFGSTVQLMRDQEGQRRWSVKFQNFPIKDLK